MNIKKKIVDLDHALVAAHLKAVQIDTGKVMIHHDQRIRNGRSHLRPHYDRSGQLYVKVGWRGSGRMYLTKCEITWLDDITLFSFMRDPNEFEIRQRQRLDAELAAIALKYDILP